MRSLAAFLAETDPDVTALCEIDAGDALAVATRFDRQWAYRGGQALLWKSRIVAHTVHDLYLPVAPLAFERRGLLRVDGEYENRELTLFATQFSADRTRIRELRFARTHARSAPGDAVIFIASPDERIAFADLGYASARTGRADLDVAVRGFGVERLRSGVLGGGVGTVLLVRASRFTL